MKLVQSLVLLTCALWEATGYPYNYYHGYGNMDSLSYGSSDNSRGGVVLSRYYNPYYNPRASSEGMAAFMYRPESQVQAIPQTAQYYYPDRRRQTTLDYAPQQNEVIPQQNEQFIPQQPEIPLSATEATEIADPTEKSETFSTTSKALPEIIEPETEDVEEPAPKPKKAVSRKKQVKKPVVDEEDDDDYAPKIPASAFFPMLFYGGRSSASGPGAPTAIANAYSTGRGGVATSHATAYGVPRPEEQRYKSH